MPTLDTLALFLGATLLLNLTPGPDMLYIIARASAQGRTAGLVSALGISAGCVVHLLLVVLGVAGVLAQWPMGLRLVQLAGALYLLWIGGNMLRSSVEQRSALLAPQALSRVFYQGVLTNALNPKVALFFLAFLPQFADPQRGALALQLGLLGGLFILNSTLVCALIALLAGRLHSAQATRRATWVKRGSGLLLFSLGLYLLLFSH